MNKEKFNLLKMKRSLYTNQILKRSTSNVTVLLLILFFIYSCNEGNKSINYPIIGKTDVVDTYFGQKIVDPYRNLENIEDSLVKEWFKGQNTLADSVLKNIHNRNYIIDLQKEYDTKRSHIVSRKTSRENGAYFFLKQKSKENIAKLYYRSSFESSDSLLFDPSGYKPEDTLNTYIINYISPDWDGDQVVVSLSKRGEEKSDLLLINVKSKEIISNITSNAAPQVLKGISWLPDNSGFIFQKVPNFEKNNPSYLHNTSALLYHINKDENYNFKNLFSKSTHSILGIKSEDFPIVSYKNRSNDYVFGEVHGATPFVDTYFTKIDDLDSNEISWKLLFTKNEKIKSYTVIDDDLIYLTAKNASNFKICKTSITKPDFVNPEILVKEKKDVVITNFKFTKYGMYYTTLKNGVNAKLFAISKNGKEKEIVLPKKSGTIIIGSNGVTSDYLKVLSAGWVNPRKTYRYDHPNERFIADDISVDPIAKYFNDLVVKEIEVESHDGALVPLSIIHKSDLKLDGNNSTLIWGYGSYGTSFRPTFNISLLTWVKAGGILAIAHVRGGGEKGNDWHQGGLKTTKPNTWKDAIACTEFLIKKNYTNSNKTAIFGSSAGGIMMGRAITERPDLFKVAIGDVPSMNMIRSEITTNGLNSVKEFGTVKDSIEFKSLFEMDSYHHIKDKVNYPATLIASGFNDARVATWSPGKFVARLQETNTSNGPILFSVDFDAGHSVRDNKEKTFDKFANYYAFALWQTGHPDYQPKD